VPTQARTPAEHYREAVRLVGVAQSPGVDPGIQQTAALVAIASALLAAVPRRARRVERPGRHAHGGSPEQQWLYGDHDEGGKR